MPKTNERSFNRRSRSALIPVQSSLIGSSFNVMAHRPIVSSNPALRYPGIQCVLREEAMPGMLDGKVALVTGRGGGIGRAPALAMVRERARVAVADFDAAAARDTVAQITAMGIAGGQAITLTGDG